jgi:hypothetical protein
VLSIRNGLADIPRWVAWREEIIKRKDGTELATKIPYDPHNGRRARIPTDPSTWGSRKQAERRWRELDDGRRGGVGIVLRALDPDHLLMGIDLDRCVDKQGFIRSWADEILDRFDTYAEASPSGRGVKLFFLVAAKDGDRIKDLLGGKTRKAFVAGKHREIAIDRARFYAVTGEQLDDTPELLRTVTVDDVRWFIETAGPRFLQRYKATNNESASTKPRDESGSGYGFRFLRDYKQQGLTYKRRGPQSSQTIAGPVNGRDVRPSATSSWRGITPRRAQKSARSRCEPSPTLRRWTSIGFGTHSFLLAWSR